jgi:hypothetical protein
MTSGAEAALPSLAGEGMVRSRRDNFNKPRLSSWFKVVDVVSRVAPIKSASSAWVIGR